MSCESIKSDIASLNSEVNSLISRYRSVRQQIVSLDVGVPAGQQLDGAIANGTALADEMLRIIASAGELAAKGNQLSKDANSQGCGTTLANEALQVQSLAETVSMNAEEAKKDAENKIIFGKQRAQSELSASKTNNAGDGTPGSAGKVPTIDDLQEVQTTKRGLSAPPITTDPSLLATPSTTDIAKGISEPPVPKGVITVPAEPTLTAPPTNADIIKGLGSPAVKIDEKLENARSAAEQTRAFSLAQQGDWRVRLSLAPAANYLYMAQNPGILAPLKRTNGIVFPYTPSIQVSYLANYDQASVTHSNYKIFQYQNSAVENITIGCDFTAQDIGEANYVLAVIHFLRSVTKMFYGQDQDPKPGTPPPLCYLYGLGQFQFSGQALVINSFNYTLPTDVDYIRADAAVGKGNPLGDKIGRESESGFSQLDSKGSAKNTRLVQSSTPIAPGGVKPLAALDTSKNLPTYVPTKINIQFTAYPIVTRNDVSRKFSLAEYSSGNLILGDKGAFW